MCSQKVSKCIGVHGLFASSCGLISVIMSSFLSLELSDEVPEFSEYLQGDSDYLILGPSIHHPTTLVDQEYLAMTS